MEEGRTMKKLFGVLAFLSFFWLLGVVGAIEQDMMALGIGTFHMALALACFYVFCKLSGAFDPVPRKRKSRPRCADRKTASVKAHFDYNKHF